MIHFVVLWSAKGSNILFEADIIASCPKDARVTFRALFPNDDVWGVKAWKGNGRFV
jgi:hypothetical protein